MDLPDKIRNYIITPLWRTSEISSGNYCFEEGTSLMRDYIVNIKNYKCIVPNIVYNTITDLYINNKKRVFPKNATIVAPNILYKPIITCKTFNSFIKYFNKTYYWSYEIHTQIGVYYVGNGVIFDENLNPLILYCKKVNTAVSEVSPNIVHAELVNKWVRPEESIIYINPEVFINQKNFVNKGIIQKIIPALMGDYCREMLMTNYINPTPKIIISNEINNFINTVYPPSTLDNNDDVINDILLKNLSDMDNCFYLDGFKTA